MITITKTWVTYDNSNGMLADIRYINSIRSNTYLIFLSFGYREKTMIFPHMYTKCLS